MFKVKISPDQITYGPQEFEVDELVAFVVAGELMQKGYRRVSNAYCQVARIDRDDWLDILAKERRCSRADFYNVNGTGVGDQHRDHYIRVFSQDILTVSPTILRRIPSY